jgi:hypothetical protein
MEHKPPESGRESEFGYFDEVPLPEEYGEGEWYPGVDYVSLVASADELSAEVAEQMKEWELAGWSVRTQLDDEDALVAVVMRRSAARGFLSRTRQVRQSCSDSRGVKSAVIRG